MASKWTNLDWDALAEDANNGMNGNGAMVEATHRAVKSETRMSILMVVLTVAILGFTVAIAWWTYEMVNERSAEIVPPQQSSVHQGKPEAPPQ